MAKPNKTYGVKYGIVITKPWNTQMYDHNDKVAEVMKENIGKTLREVYDEALSLDDESLLRKVSRSICYYGFGEGFDTEHIYEETKQELENIPNYQLNETYADLEKDNLVPELEEYLIGYDK
jgi:hypothetical protein